MRELKYRVWYKNKYIELTNLRGKKSIYFSIYDLGVITQSIDRKEVVLEQYTGLKDKNGKEIYEGDIVSEEFEYGGEKTKTIWQVRWCDDECVFELHYVSGFEVDDCSLVADDEENCEVIGNIHENSELLKEEK